MNESQSFVRVTDLRAMGWSRVDAERLHRRASRRHGFYRLGKFNYVDRAAIEEAIQEAKVETT